VQTTIVESDERQSELITRHAASREYGLSPPQGLRGLVERGLVRMHDVGGRLLIDRAELERALHEWSTRPEHCPGCGDPLPPGRDFHGGACYRRTPQARAEVRARLSRPASHPSRTWRARLARLKAAHGLRDAAEVAALLHIDKSTVYSRARALGVGQRDGRFVLFTDSDVARIRSSLPVGAPPARCACGATIQTRGALRCGRCLALHNRQRLPERTRAYYDDLKARARAEGFVAVGLPELAEQVNARLDAPRSGAWIAQVAQRLKAGEPRGKIRAHTEKDIDAITAAIANNPDPMAILHRDPAWRARWYRRAHGSLALYAELGVAREIATGRGKRFGRPPAISHELAPTVIALRGAGAGYRQIAREVLGDEGSFMAVKRFLDSLTI
jgi:hypothetical protein